MSARAVPLALCLALVSCATAPQPPTTVSEFDTYDGREFLVWSVSSEGAAYFRDGQREFRFAVTRERAARVAALARRLIAVGRSDCEQPEYTSERHVTIAGGSAEERGQFRYGCGDASAQRAADAFFRVGEDLRILGMVEANSRPLQATSITVRYLSWGRARSWWSITREGEGHYFEENMEHTFSTSPELFDHVYEIMRPWQSGGISCSTAPTDGPYGEITFAAGAEERRSGWRLGCGGPNSDALYSRLDEAGDIVRAVAIPH